MKSEKEINIEIGNANNQIQALGEADAYLYGWIDALTWVLKEENKDG